MLAQLFFGAGAAVFLFCRGVSDSMVIFELERTMRSWSFPDFPMNEVWSVLFMLFILFVNLPLCLWAAHVGAQRSIYVWYRLRGKPVKAGEGSRPMLNFLFILAASIAAGLAAAFVISYAR